MRYIIVVYVLFQGGYKNDGAFAPTFSQFFCQRNAALLRHLDIQKKKVERTGGFQKLRCTIKAFDFTMLVEVLYISLYLLRQNPAGDRLIVAYRNFHHNISFIIGSFLSPIFSKQEVIATKLLQNVAIVLQMAPTALYRKKQGFTSKLTCGQFHSPFLRLLKK